MLSPLDELASVWLPMLSRSILSVCRLWSACTGGLSAVRSTVPELFCLNVRIDRGCCTRCRSGSGLSLSRSMTCGGAAVVLLACNTLCSCPDVRQSALRDCQKAELCCLFTDSPFTAMNEGLDMFSCCLLLGLPDVNDMALSVDRERPSELLLVSTPDRLCDNTLSRPLGAALRFVDAVRVRPQLLMRGGASSISMS